MSGPGLYLDFVGRDAMAFACHRWHYSRSMPASKIIGIGAWEADRYIGCVTFSRGASSQIHSPFNVEQDAICELTRVALGPHVTPTSRIVALAVRLLRKQSPGLRLIVSFADPEHGHLGVLYQSMNFWYLGTTNRESLIRLNGRLVHPRTISSKHHTRSIAWLRTNVAADAEHVRTLPKFRYVLPLDRDMRRQLAPRVQPYPKREREQSAESGTPGSTRRGRIDTTCSLHVQEPAHV